MKPRAILNRIEKNFRTGTHFGHPELMNLLEQAMVTYGKKERLAEREECAKLAEIKPESRFDLDREPAPTEQQIRQGIAHLIRERK